MITRNIPCLVIVIFSDEVAKNSNRNRFGKTERYPQIFGEMAGHEQECIPMECVPATH